MNDSVPRSCNRISCFDALSIAASEGPNNRTSKSVSMRPGVSATPATSRASGEQRASRANIESRTLTGTLPIGADSSSRTK